MILERTNNQIKPIVINPKRVMVAPNGSDLTSGDRAGNTIQLRIPIGAAARAQVPRILPSEYYPPISATAFTLSCLP
jgi:hypothetical protein